MTGENPKASVTPRPPWEGVPCREAQDWPGIYCGHLPTANPRGPVPSGPIIWCSLPGPDPSVWLKIPSATSPSSDGWVSPCSPNRCLWGLHFLRLLTLFSSSSSFSIKWDSAVVSESWKKSSKPLETEMFQGHDSGWQGQPCVLGKAPGIPLMLSAPPWREPLCNWAESNLLMTQGLKCLRSTHHPFSHHFLSPRIVWHPLC